MRASNSASSSSRMALARDIIWRRCLILANLSLGAAPTRSVGESGVFSSGCAFSSSSNSRKRRSYSASLRVGASST